ncbi:undecaprenyl-diphosphatase [Andreprevotia chitinilytica]|uniref:undecaprenyl-diphosphatase n=1 Tax=Andreprevotia chitinilytica TaxID=396808 RepID=UPI00054ECEFF|nr:undecaprenyl-diphosphatase [Andreprevotia chitinilytica]
MEELNTMLFLLINAPAHPAAGWLMVATFFAEQAIWLVPISLLVGWFKGGEETRKLMLQAAVAGLTGLLLNQLIGLVWQHPRPFMIGLGHTLIPHVADSSFPSDHLTLLWAVAGNFLLHARTRRAGLFLSVLGIPVAWGRIYLGVHFPFDMVGAVAVAAQSAWLALWAQSWLINPLFRWISRIYQFLFAPMIRRGWLLK